MQTYPKNSDEQKQKQKYTVKQTQRQQNKSRKLNHTYDNNWQFLSNIQEESDCAEW